jgi:hypothetical protein
MVSEESKIYPKMSNSLNNNGFESTLLVNGSFGRLEMVLECMLDVRGNLSC